MRPIQLGALVVGAAAMAVGVTAAAGASAPDRTTFTYNAGMNGAREVPGPGDQNASGHAVITIDTSTGEICWDLTVRNIDGDIFAAHIHIADRQSPGPIDQGLSPPVDGTSSGCVVNAAVANAVVGNPSGYYVNVHSTTFPAGAVRGQLAGPHG